MQDFNDSYPSTADDIVPASPKPNYIELPQPKLTGEMSLEEALLKRRSVREYNQIPLNLFKASQLLWAAQGETDKSGKRTAPSAGALYPLEVYLVAGNVEQLQAGIYHYIPGKHLLTVVKSGDVRAELKAAALNQSCVGEGAIVIVIAAVYARTEVKYGERAERYVHMEAGHAAQNICLEAAALSLGAVTVGAFDDERVSQIMGMPESEVPLYIIPVGNK